MVSGDWLQAGPIEKQLCCPRHWLRGTTFSGQELAPGSPAGLWMIRSGYAHEYTYDVPYYYQARFKKAERQAREQEGGFWAPETCGGDTTQLAEQPTPTPRPRPAATPTPGPESEEPPASNCDRNYEGACVPPYPPDVDCGDIGETVYVVGSDPHGLDRDGDKVACESS